MRSMSGGVLSVVTAVQDLATKRAPGSSSAFRESRRFGRTTQRPPDHHVAHRVGVGHSAQSDRMSSTVRGVRRGARAPRGRARRGRRAGPGRWRPRLRFSDWAPATAGAVEEHPAGLPWPRPRVRRPRCGADGAGAGRICYAQLVGQWRSARYVAATPKRPPAMVAAWRKRPSPRLASVAGQSPATTPVRAGALPLGASVMRRVHQRPPPIEPRVRQQPLHGPAEPAHLSTSRALGGMDAHGAVGDRPRSRRRRSAGTGGGCAARCRPLPC